MLHARVIHPPAFGATLVSVDEASIGGIGGARVVRIQSFLAVVADREWDAVRAARALKAQWSAGTGLGDHSKEFEAMRAAPVVRDQEIAKRGDLAALSAPPAGTRTLPRPIAGPCRPTAPSGRPAAWPTCGRTASRSGARPRTCTASRAPCARMLGVERDRVRVIYMDGAGSYGANGADDAAAEAALLSKAVGPPGAGAGGAGRRSTGSIPRAPHKLLELRGAVDKDGEIAAWETQAWLPISTANLPNIPLVSLDAAGIPQTPGRATGP